MGMVCLHVELMHTEEEALDGQKHQALEFCFEAAGLLIFPP